MNKPIIETEESKELNRHAEDIKEISATKIRKQLRDEGKL